MTAHAPVPGAELARPAWLADVADVQASAAAELAQLRADFGAWLITEDGGPAAGGRGLAAILGTAPGREPVHAATPDGMRAALAAAQAPPALPAAPTGTAYLLHFSRPLSHARHYTGFSRRLAARLRLHLAGRSRVPLIRAAVAAGITLELAATWPGVTREFERQLKNRHGAARYCPVCKAEAASAAAVTGRFPGRPESAHAARDLARAVLAGHPCADDADLCVTELVANAVAYSRSGWMPGGMVTVTVQAEPGGALIRVRDQGGPGAPAPGSGPAGLGEHGRGLVLVGALAAEWGSDAEGAGRVTWCRLAAAEVTR